jgi:arginase
VGVSLVALRCRTADRFAGAPRGVEILAPLVGNALGVEPRFIGAPGEISETRYEEDLRDARGCLLEAGGQVEDALSGGNTPVLLAADCDYNTPDTTGSGYLGGMCLAAATGEWDAGLGETVPAERVVLAGIRDLDAGERELLEKSPATVIGASAVETLVAAKNALDSAPIFVHLDLDVIDPEHFPAAVPAPNGLHPDKLYDLIDSVLEDCELVGMEVTAIELPEDEDASAIATETAMHVLEPFLEHLTGDS